MNTAVKRQRKSRVRNSLGEILELLSHARLERRADGPEVIRDTLLLVFVSLQRKEISNLDAKALCFFLQRELNRLTVAAEDGQFLSQHRN